MFLSVRHEWYVEATANVNECHVWTGTGHCYFNFGCQDTGTLFNELTMK